MVIERLNGLVDQLIVYGRNMDPLCYTMHFVDGLRDDIKVSVHLHGPTLLDFACALALLLEELAGCWSEEALPQAG